jgi:hypothetical protein
MTKGKQSRGKCAFCGREMAKGGLTRHLAACTKRQEAMRAADQKRGRGQALYHLQVQDAWRGDYWLHLEMKGSATLEDLDDYLRAIWLECCGHMSRFSVGGWRGDDIPMKVRAEWVFEPGVREGKPLTAHPIVLMARNDPPEFLCVECGQPASWLCVECVYELEEPGTLCNEHAQNHPHEDYGEPMPLVNSPRVGMCGYVGPAEPPY